MTSPFLFSPDAIEIAALPSVYPDKVAVASIPESILTTSQQERESSSSSSWTEDSRETTNQRQTHTHKHKIQIS